jgi:hypothetical protein
MPGPVRDQRLAHEALVAKVKAEMEADGKRVIAARKRNELENRKAQRALAYQWRFAYSQRRLVTWFHVGIDAVAFDMTDKEVDRKVPAPILARIITAYHCGRTTTQLVRRPSWLPQLSGANHPDAIRRRMRVQAL